MTVAGLLLAAGAGTRFGRPKALVELGGETLVARGVRLLTDGGCSPVVVVLGAWADRVQDAVPLPGVVVAADWETGMGASLRAGLQALEAQGATACVVALADQPLVGPEAVARLLAAHERGAVAAVATYDGQPRNPVLLARSTWAEVAAGATGDAGARHWLRTHPEQVTAVPCDDAGTPFDIDTPEDLAHLEAPA
ncbi:MAG: nucleotidyltransferase family protein [Mycobacteriales bacterium]